MLAWLVSIGDAGMAGIYRRCWHGLLVVITLSSTPIDENSMWHEVVATFVYCLSPCVGSLVLTPTDQIIWVLNSFTARMPFLILYACKLWTGTVSRWHAIFGPVLCHGGMQALDRYCVAVACTSSEGLISTLEWLISFSCIEPIGRTKRVENHSLASTENFIFRREVDRPHWAYLTALHYTSFSQLTAYWWH